MSVTSEATGRHNLTGCSHEGILDFVIGFFCIQWNAHAISDLKSICMKEYNYSELVSLMGIWSWWNRSGSEESGGTGQERMGGPVPPLSYEWLFHTLYTYMKFCNNKSNNQNLHWNLFLSPKLSYLFNCVLCWFSYRCLFILLLNSLYMFISVILCLLYCGSSKSLFSETVNHRNNVLVFLCYVFTVGLGHLGLDHWLVLLVWISILPTLSVHLDLYLLLPNLAAFESSSFVFVVPSWGYSG